MSSFFIPKFYSIDWFVVFFLLFSFQLQPSVSKVQESTNQCSFLDQRHLNLKLVKQSICLVKFLMQVKRFVKLNWFSDPHVWKLKALWLYGWVLGVCVCVSIYEPRTTIIYELLVWVVYALGKRGRGQLEIEHPSKRIWLSIKCILIMQWASFANAITSVCRLRRYKNIMHKVFGNL